MRYLSKEEKEYMTEKIVNERLKNNKKADFESMINLSDNVIVAIYSQEIEKEAKPSNQMTLEEWENDTEVQDKLEEQYWDQVWQDYQNGKLEIKNFDNGKIIPDIKKMEMIEKMNEEMQRRSR